MAASPTPIAAGRRTWVVSPGWDLAYLVLTPLAIVPVVLLLVRRWLAPEQVYLAVISFASVGHHLPGFMRAYGDRELFTRFRWRFLAAPPLAFALALLMTPPAAVAETLGLPWSHLHTLELVLLVWGAWHGLMQTYGFMRIYDLRRGDDDWATARLDHALCVAIFVAGIVFSDVRMFSMAGAMWQAGLPLFGPQTLRAVRWAVGVAAVVVATLYMLNAIRRRAGGVATNWVKLLLVGVTGWFWWYCGRLSTNLLVGVAMFEIFHAVQYNAIVWTYNRRLVSRSGRQFGPLAFIFSDRLAMLGIYLGAIAAYSSIRFFTAGPGDRMFGGTAASPHQWLIAWFVTSSLLHFYYDGFIWKVSEAKTKENFVDQPPAGPSLERFVPAAVHAGKWAMLLAVMAALVVAERRYQERDLSTRQAAERKALAALTPEVPEAAMLASQEAAARGDSKTAAALAARAAQSRPASRRNKQELAWALMAAGKYQDAKQALREAISLEPGHWQDHCDLGEVHAALGEMPEAEAAYRRAVKLGPQEFEPHLRLGALLTQLGRPGDGLEALSRAVEVDPNSAEAAYHSGLAQLTLGDAISAVPMLRRAVRLDRQHYPAWLQLGDAWAALEKPQAAREAYAHAVELRPAEAPARICLADAMVKLGETAGAELILREGLRFQPESAELSFTLGVLLRHRGAVKEADELLRKAAVGGLRVP